MTFSGFPTKVKFTPVPNPFFNELLEQIDSLSELKCTMRIIWLLSQKNGSSKFVTFRELQNDEILYKSFTQSGKDPLSALNQGLKMALQRETILVKTNPDNENDKIYILNKQDDRSTHEVIFNEQTEEYSNHITSFKSNELRPNIFVLYENNIGMLNPIISQELKDAEELYPQNWIEDAFKEAVINNKRSWKYILAILNRWNQEGKSDGRSFRYPEENSFQRYPSR